MEKEYEKNVKEYQRVSSETRNKLTALSITVIGAIYFFSTPQNLGIFKLSLFFYFLTIVCEVVSGFCKSEHYALWIEGKIDSIDYRSSLYGKIADTFFWGAAIIFILGTVLFFYGLLAFKPNTASNGQNNSYIRNELFYTEKGFHGTNRKGHKRFCPSEKIPEGGKIYLNK